MTALICKGKQNLNGTERIGEDFTIMRRKEKQTGQTERRKKPQNLEEHDG